MRLLPGAALGEALGQLREGRLPPGQLFGSGLKAHFLGLRAPKGRRGSAQSGQLSVQLPEGGAALFSSGVLEGGGVPGGRKLLSRLSSPSKAARSAFARSSFPASASSAAASRVAGRFGLGGVQNGPQSVTHRACAAVSSRRSFSACSARPSVC